MRLLLIYPKNVYLHISFCLGGSREIKDNANVMGELHPLECLKSHEGRLMFNLLYLMWC